ncbi:hypothetical protein AB1Y20_016881 [Prymnesium parvum]|uniref:Secreted protein n=1 Tax=Prymnesium parvum TaxID=97485 RepID=A0AB34IA98_PRYPA
MLNSRAFLLETAEACLVLGAALLIGCCCQARAATRRACGWLVYPAARSARGWGSQTLSACLEMHAEALAVSRQPHGRRTSSWRAPFAGGRAAVGRILGHLEARANLCYSEMLSFDRHLLLVHAVVPGCLAGRFPLTCYPWSVRPSVPNVCRGHALHVSVPLLLTFRGSARDTISRRGMSVL